MITSQKPPHPACLAAASVELLPRYARVAALCDPAGAAGALPAQLPKAPALALKEVDALENASVGE